MRKFALLIGVDEYHDPDISGLRFAAVDVTAVAERLRTRCGFDQVTVLADAAGPGSPTKPAVLRQLKGLSGELRADDLFLFFFSGHGIEVDQHAFLLLADSQQAFPADTGLSLDLLRKNFAYLSAGRRVLIIDACRNDPHAGRGDTDNCMGNVMSRDLMAVAKESSAGKAPSTTILLSACSAGERAYEFPAKGHGVFTHYLLEGIDGRAWTGDVLRLPDLARYAAGEVTRWSSSTPGLHTPQTPWYEQMGYYEVVLARRGEGAGMPGDLPQPVSPPRTNPPPSLDLNEYRRRIEQEQQQRQEEEKRLREQMTEAERRRKDAEYDALRGQLAADFDQRDFEAADKTVKAMLALRGDDEEARRNQEFITTQLERARYAALAAQFSAQKQAKDFAGAIKTLDAMVALRPGDEEVKADKRFIGLQQQTVRHQEAKAWVEALEPALHAAQLRPDDEWVKQTLAALQTSVAAMSVPVGIASEWQKQRELLQESAAKRNWAGAQAARQQLVALKTVSRPGNAGPSPASDGSGFLKFVGVCIVLWLAYHYGWLGKARDYAMDKWNQWHPQPVGHNDNTIANLHHHAYLKGEVWGTGGGALDSLGSVNGLSCTNAGGDTIIGQIRTRRLGNLLGVRGLGALDPTGSAGVGAGGLSGHDDEVQLWKLGADAPYWHWSSVGNLSALTVAPMGRYLAYNYDPPLRLPSGSLSTRMVNSSTQASAKLFELDPNDPPRIQLWDLRKLSFFDLQGHASAARALDFSPDDQYLLSGGGDGKLLLWRCSDHSLARTIIASGPAVVAVAFASWGHEALVAYAGNDVQCWDTDAGQVVRTLPGSGPQATNLALSGDGRRAMVATFNGSWQLWDLAAGRLLQSAKVSPAFLTGIALSRDGRRALTGSSDGIMRLWDADAGTVVSTFSTYGGGLATYPSVIVAFTPDEKSAFSGAQDGTVRQWPLPSAGK